MARIRAAWRHLPPHGVLLFFDVKPVYVKAFGGRRYTSAKRLVLPRYQKTHGKFYLFALYEVNRGRVRWMFLPRKNSENVCRFLRQVRRWYPDQPIWVVLDQDRAHPRKSETTRRQVRELQLHWIKLPKGSPDDNPVETLFSDIHQQMILDNSDDTEPQMTQRRISLHWRRRNRRRDRPIHIAYLPQDAHDSHKQ